MKIDDSQTKTASIVGPAKISFILLEQDYFFFTCSGQKHDKNTKQ